MTLGEYLHDRNWLVVQESWPKQPATILIYPDVIAQSPIKFGLSYDAHCEDPKCYAEKTGIINGFINKEYLDAPVLEHGLRSFERDGEEYVYCYVRLDREAK